MSALNPRHVEDLLARGVRELVSGAGAEAGVVLLSMRRGDRFVLRAPVGFDPAALVEIGGFVGAEEGLGPVYRAAGFESFARAPLELDGISAGAVHVVARAQKPLAGVREAARSLAPLAFALHGLEAAESERERGEVVSQVAQGVLHHLELTGLFPELIRLVARLCPCDASSVAVYRPESDAFELAAVYGMGLPEAIRPGVVIPATETPMKEAWLSGKLVSEPDGRASAHARSRTLAASGIVSALYLPIGNPRRGIFCVGHRLPFAFGEEETTLYESLVPFLEIALRNAELVSKIRAAYRELDATQERLVRSERLRALGELAAGVAHDVGNVLAVVASHAELLARRAPDEETKRLVASCMQSVQDGAQAVRRVLDMARGQPAPESEKPRFSLDAVTREAALFTEARWKRAGFSIDLSGLEPVPEAPGRAAEVREAIANIILNAVDAMPGGGQIALRTRVDEEHVLFVIEDSGPGVPPALRERIFEPFYTSKGANHAGLGLAIVSRLARQTGGSVRVLDATLGGARFELRLPLRELGSGPHELPKVEPTKALGRSIEVLLVEDEPALRRALSALLALRGHVVVTAADVAEGLLVLEKQPTIQVVVTDLGLPGRSGWELVAEIRKRWVKLPIVVLSGLGALTDPAAARERGVSAILAKPTSEKELAAAIEALVPERKEALDLRAAP